MLICLFVYFSYKDFISFLKLSYSNSIWLVFMKLHFFYCRFVNLYSFILLLITDISQHLVFINKSYHIACFKFCRSCARSDHSPCISIYFLRKPFCPLLKPYVSLEKCLCFLYWHIFTSRSHDIPTIHVNLSSYHRLTAPLISEEKLVLLVARGMVSTYCTYCR